MILGIGIDLVQNSRIAKMRKRYGVNFLNKFLNRLEIKEVIKSTKNDHLSGVFALKEAIMKAVSNAFGIKISFHNITLGKNSFGIQYVKSISKFKDKEKLKTIKFHLSVTHEKHYSMALVICEKVI